MTTQWLLLWTDILLYVLITTITLMIWRATRQAHLRAAFKTIVSKRSGMITLLILTTYMSIAILDSVHFRVTTTNGNISAVQQPVQSLLDWSIAPLGQATEKTYSKPFATYLYNKETVLQDDGSVAHTYPPLEHAGQHLQNSDRSVQTDIKIKTVAALGIGLLAALVLQGLLILAIKLATHKSSYLILKDILTNRTILPWRCGFITITIICCTIAWALYLSQYYHLLGTDKVGADVLYESVKSIRTGLLIGTLTTLVMLPFALLFGTVAGYFGGRLDDLIQYLYTTLSSIPGVLLIAAAILSLQVTISLHPDAFPTLAQRADARLLALCIILGVTSWTGLCRVLRAETLKVRELDYVQAARSLGAKHFRIIRKHILPNIMHIVIISVILDFSTLVLAEAVLSYIGIGVDPTTISWGNMINAARLEMAREPLVWWPLLAAFMFMFTLVLSANIFSDAVRDGFDPRLNNQD